MSIMYNHITTTTTNNNNNYTTTTTTITMTVTITITITIDVPVANPAHQGQAEFANGELASVGIHQREVQWEGVRRMGVVLYNTTSI